MSIDSADLELAFTPVENSSLIDQASEIAQAADQEHEENRESKIQQFVPYEVRYQIESIRNHVGSMDQKVDVEQMKQNADRNIKEETDPDEKEWKQRQRIRLDSISINPETVRGESLDFLLESIERLRQQIYNSINSKGIKPIQSLIPEMICLGYIEEQQIRLQQQVYSWRSAPSLIQQKEYQQRLRTEPRESIKDFIKRWSKRQGDYSTRPEQLENLIPAQVSEIFPAVKTANDLNLAA